LQRASPSRARKSPPFAAAVLLGFTALGAAAPSGDPPASRAAETAGTAKTTDTSPGPRSSGEASWITLETNAPPALGPAPERPDGDRGARWDSSWAGWDGWHVAVTRRARFEDPFAAARGWLHGTNPARAVHLDEVRMSAKIGGKFAVDGAAFVTDPEWDDFDAGVELRRARLFARGDCLLVLPVSYQIEVGYIPEQFYLEESFLSFKDIPWIGEIKAGQYQAPMGLDVITGSRDITFMEPAAPLQALAPGVNAGVQIGRPVLEQRASWRIGLFADGVGQDFGEASRDYGRAIVRFTGLPWYRPSQADGGGAELLHVGVSANVLYSASSSVRYRSRPESHLAPHVLDTGDIEADQSMVVGAEVAWVHGPLSPPGRVPALLGAPTGRRGPGLRGRLPFRQLDSDGGVTAVRRPRGPCSVGWCREGTSTLVGEAGAPGKSRPGIPTRISTAAESTGGRLSMWMAGVNWYPHGHVRWRFDYGLGRVLTPERGERSPGLRNAGGGRFLIGRRRGLKSASGWRHDRGTVTARRVLLFLAVLPIWALAAPGQSRLLGPSPRDDLETGAELAKQIEREIGLVTAPKAQAYVREVGGRLVDVVDDPRWQFHFEIVDQSEPNAFAIPGGGIYVSRGLLVLLGGRTNSPGCWDTRSPMSRSGIRPGNSGRASCPDCFRCPGTWWAAW
jgi:hypothetical protein